MHFRFYTGRRVFSVLLSLFTMTGAAHLNAQTFRGGINGTIVDASGAVVAGAAVVQQRKTMERA